MSNTNHWRPEPVEIVHQPSRLGVLALFGCGVICIMVTLIVSGIPRVF